MTPRSSTTSFLRRGWRAVVAWPSWGLLGLIRGYQWTLSPVLPLVLGPGFGCRFYPSCSQYAAEAVTTHGAAKGAWLAARRLLRCQPLHPGGIDHVPAKKSPVCHAVVTSASLSRPNAFTLNG
ncbi:MAG TPA: membrane protein insertion efficiency factor YidD [Opitutaceae bacterium]|nr:membrane protein insertion efficiency factor YidD [Opitutaceae bacterium]